MTNEEKFKNELDWLKANYPLIGDHDFKLDIVVHVTVGRIAELLYEHAFGCGRLGAAVSASPQPSVDIKQKCINFICQNPYPAWDQLVELVESCFAAAPAQEPDPEKQRWQAQMQSEVSAAHVCAEAAARPSLASLHPDCPNCSGPLSYTHNKTLSFFSCNGRCKGTFELHSAQDMVKFFKPAPAQEPRIGEPCPTCERTYLGKMGPGDYSCCVCGMGMVEPCEHWKSFDENAAQEQPVENSRSVTGAINGCGCVCHTVGLFGLMCCPCTKKDLDELVNGKRGIPVAPPSPQKGKP